MLAKLRIYRHEVAVRGRASSIVMEARDGGSMRVNAARVDPGLRRRYIEVFCTGFFVQRSTQWVAR